MDLGISGKGALVCGASRGLGKAVAEELCREGVRVVICARNTDELEQAARDLREKTGGHVHAVVADVSTRAGCATAVAAALQSLQQVDILVTNSGGPPPGPFEAHSSDVWDATYHQLLASAVELVRGVLPGMKQRRWGRIIAITSQAVKQPVDGLILSNSVRASVVGLVRTLANEVGQFGITVNNVMPGYTRTARLEKLIANAPQFGNVTSEIPARRLGEPHEFAAAVAFLASERAAYINGASIPVDGGWIKSLL